MLGAIVWIVVYIVTGAALLVAAAFAAAWLLAREVNAGHERTCSCPKCQRKRQREWEAAQEQPLVNEPRRPGWVKDRKPPPNRQDWLSTVELRVGMSVIGRNGALYEVTSVTRIAFGYMVVLSNVGTGKPSEVPIPGDKTHQRIWLVRERKRRA
jgi:hypothetical protein